MPEPGCTDHHVHRMLGRLKATSSNGLLSDKAGRGRRLILLALFIVCYVFGFGYHFLLFSRGEPLSPPVQAVYHFLVLAAYTSLWFLFSAYFKNRRTSPSTVFWTTLVLGAVLLGIARLVIGIGRPPVSTPNALALGFEVDPSSRTYVPLTLATVVKMNALSVLEGSFALFLLHRFRDLALFKRTKGSQRNWYLMIGAMTLASVSTFMIEPDPDRLPLLQTLAVIPAVILMVINSFRLSWIPFLSFRGKTASLGLAVLLLGLLVGGLLFGDAGFLPGADTYIVNYSFPLRQFSLLSIVFGILYCTTAFLSLLFHLPTTGDFQQKVDEMAAMYSLTSLVSQVFDPERLAAMITASPVEAGTAHRAWLAITDPQSGSLRPRLASVRGAAVERIREMVDTDAFFEEVYQKREPVLVDQAPADHRITARPGDSLGSLLAVPLIARNELLGALFVTKDVTHGFEQDDVEAMTVFAAQAALALDHARLFEEQVEKERLKRELTIAREVQHKLLPQVLPHPPGVAIAASSVSAQEVGGDYYDFVQVDENRLALIIADVSGKGTHAAFYMAEMQGIFRAVSRLAPRPIDFLVHANDALNMALDKHIFISVIYGLLDLEKEELYLARAGHCPAAMIGISGEARFLRSQGLGLGLDRGSRFQETLVEERIRLQPGDVFALYTDGVVESRNRSGEEYGYDRLLGFLKEHRYEGAHELHGSLLENLQAFTEDETYDDDMTLVVLKWHGIELPETVAGGDSRISRIQDDIALASTKTG